MTIIEQCFASYYTCKSSPNKTVSMLASKACPVCHGHKINTINGDRCLRCSGDGYLTNRMDFNENLFECAMPVSIMERFKLTLGDVLQVTSRIETGPQTVTVRLVDVMGEDNGHLRWIDLTKRAFKEIAPLRMGLVEVCIERIIS